jgi:hypothetical protein
MMEDGGSKIGETSERKYGLGRSGRYPREKILDENDLERQTGSLARNVRLTIAWIWMGSARLSLLVPSSYGTAAPEISSQGILARTRHGQRRGVVPSKLYNAPDTST